MRVLAALFLILTLVACKDGLVEPERFGLIQGSVSDFVTGAPIGRAGITTSPATNAITADDQGRFLIEDVVVGTYTITATRAGFQPNTVTVSVRDDRTAQATFFLKVEEDVPPSETIIGAEVLGFVNEPFATDSSFVTVEYRALNNSDVNVERYEVYFRIETDRGPFYQEIQGEDLGAGERDVATFRKRLIGATAQSVVVEGTVARETDGS